MWNLCNFHPFSLEKRSQLYFADNFLVHRRLVDNLRILQLLWQVDAVVLADILHSLRWREASTTLRLHITGTVKVTCDRCLDPMEVQLNPIEDQVVLKLAPEAGEDDNAIYVAEAQPVFDLGWLMYELIAVSLPVVHSHAEGECNPQMEAILNELKV